MTVFLGERLRYGAYALMAAAAVVAYFVMGSDPGQLPVEAGRKAFQSEDLPILQPLDTEVDQEGRRDLFAFGRAEPVVETPAVIQAPVQPPPPDLLANVQAVGLVRRSDNVTILIRVGSRLLTVGLGESFGEGNALRVASIAGRNVLIVDRSSGNSRNYHLSEE